MKKLISVLLTFVMLLSVITVTSNAAEAVTSLSNGYSNVQFSNDYKGFCLDRDKAGAYTNDVFTASNGTAAKSNIDGSDISLQLKVLFVQLFDKVFVADGAGGYIIGDTNTVQAVVWNLTDGQYVWGTQKTLADAVKSYAGDNIPDEGSKVFLENGDVVTFSFTVMQPQKDGQQEFFAYKISVENIPEHEHDYTDDWQYDETEHWFECSCGDKADKAEHKEIVINEKEAADFAEGYTGDTICEVCGYEIEKGTVIPATHEHVYSDEWENDKEKHWQKCECGDTTVPQDHIFEGGTCTVCEYKDPDYKVETPETGDNTHLGLMAMLCAVSFCGFIFTTRLKRKNKA